MSLLYSLSVVMLWATMLWPPVNPACFPATTAISGCSIVTLYLRSTDWIQRVSISLTKLNRSSFSFYPLTCTLSPVHAGLNLLLWGDLPELEDSENEEPESLSEDECIR